MKYEGERAAHYRTLKLAGLLEAPVHLAVCCHRETKVGHGLGRQTQPQALRDSVVCAIQALWLTARIHGRGVGWVSILRPAIVHDTSGIAEDVEPGRLPLHRMAGRAGNDPGTGAPRMGAPEVGNLLYCAAMTLKDWHGRCRSGTEANDAAAPSATSLCITSPSGSIIRLIECRTALIPSNTAPS